MNPRLKFDYDAITAIDDMFNVAANARMEIARLQQMQTTV
jgi:hypothetical protein